MCATEGNFFCSILELFSDILICMDASRPKQSAGFSKFGCGRCPYENLCPCPNYARHVLTFFRFLISL